MNRFVLISIGAVLGANARYLVGLWAGGRLGLAFPYGTLIVNLTGSLVLGFIAGSLAHRWIATPEMRLFLGVGFLGSYTTFSSFSVETATLLLNGNSWSVVFNVLGNTLVGLVFALLGIYLARWIG